MSILHKDNNGVIKEYTCGDSKYNLNYSTSEIDTGMTWIDGKKIYRKAIEIDPLVYSTVNTNTQLFTVSDIDSIITVKGTLWNSARTDVYNLEYTSGQNITKVYFNTSDNYFYFKSTDTWSNARLVAILEYTKTTI